MIYAINFAREEFFKQQKWNTKSALKYGKVDKVIQYRISDIDENFYENHKHIFSQSIGGGYWLWKPYIIDKTIKLVEDGDYIFYCDSGSYIIDDIHFLTNFMENYELDIFCCETAFLEFQFTKKLVFEVMECNSDKYKKTNQIMATFILLKVTDFTKKFFKEFLDYASKPNILSFESKNEDKLFIQNRSDQSIFSLLCKKYNIKPFRDISASKKQVYRDKSFSFNEKVLDSCHSYKNYFISFFNKKQAITNFKSYENSNYPKIVESYKRLDLINISHLLIELFKLHFINLKKRK